MTSENTLNIIRNFADICIFNIDPNGRIKEVVINSRDDFNPKGIRNIYDFFNKEDGNRLKDVIEVGLDEVREFFYLKNIFKTNSHIDIEVKTISGEIYVCFKFYQTYRDMAIMYEDQLKELRIAARTDPLTKLLNRYGYWERVKQMLKCGDPERRLGILLIDMDHLKMINDEKGHSAGDKAIKQISALISNTIRQRDIAVRYGGEEFVIVVEETSGSKSTAQGLARRLIREINSHKRNFLTTVSIGVHQVKVGDFTKYLNNERDLRDEWNRAVDISDEMVYQAKENGRNQAVYSNAF